MKNLSFFNYIFIKQQGRKEALENRASKLSTLLSKLQVKQKSIEEAQTFIQVTAKELQERLKYNITDIVNLAISSCFQNIEFDIDFKIMNNRTVAKLIYKKNGYEIDPLEGSGAGLVDLTTFALRIALWNISHTDNVIILDEPLKWLQPKELQMEAFKIIKELSEKLNIQFIIVANSVGSDNIIDISDRIFEVSLVNEKIQGKVWPEVSKVVMREE